MRMVIVQAVVVTAVLIWVAVSLPEPAKATDDTPARLLSMRAPAAKLEALPVAVEPASCVASGVADMQSQLAQWPMRLNVRYADIPFAGLSYASRRTVVIDATLKCKVVSAVYLHEWMHQRTADHWGNRDLAMQALGSCGEPMAKYPAVCRNYELVADCGAEWLAEQFGVFEYHPYADHASCNGFRDLAVQIAKGIK